MPGQTVNASPEIMTLNTPNNIHRSEWTCVSWFNKISDAVASKTCRFFGYAVATVVSVITFIPSLAVDFGYAAKRLYDRNITKPQTPISNQVSANGSLTRTPTQTPASLIQSPNVTQQTLPTTNTALSSNSSVITNNPSTTPVLTTSQRPDLTRHASSISPEIPRAVFIIGGSGSGKNTLADQIIQSNKNTNKRNYVLIDADNVKENMPRYQELLRAGDPEAASKVHDESLKIKDKLIEESRTNRSSVVYTGTGTHSNFYINEMNKFKNAGYYVKVYLVDVSESACIYRAQLRQNQTGRQVPLEYIKTSNKQAKLNFNNQFRHVAHTSRHYENNNSMKLLAKNKGNWAGLRTIQKRP